MDSLWIPLLVFILRIINNAISTIRVVFIARQQRIVAAILGFFESAIFAYTVASIVSDLTNPVMFFAYSGGYALGSYIGMDIEQRFVKAFNSINVFLPVGGHDLAVKLRDHGFAVTETVGDGQKGTVTMLRLIVDRRDVNQILDVVRQEQPDAFIAIEEARTIRRGYFRAPNGRLR